MSPHNVFTNEGFWFIILRLKTIELIPQSLDNTPTPYSQNLAEELWNIPDQPINEVLDPTFVISE